MSERGRAELGATAVEYAVLVGLIAVVIVSAVAALGSSLWGDDIEVLGRVLEQEGPDDPDDPGGADGLGGPGGPDCDQLPDEPLEPNPHCD